MREHHVALGELVQRGSGLLIEGEEEDAADQQHHGQHQPLALGPVALGRHVPAEVAQGDRPGHGQEPAHQLEGAHQPPDDEDPGEPQQVDQSFQIERPEDAPRDAGGIGGLSAALQQRLAEDEGHQARQHADAGQAEPGPPAHLLAERAAEDGRPGRPEVDAIIVEGEARVPPGVSLGVELADHRGDVGLQEAHPHDDEGERQVHDLDEGLVLPDALDIAPLGQHGRQR